MNPKYPEDDSLFLIAVILLFALLFKNRGIVKLKYLLVAIFGVILLAGLPLLAFVIRRRNSRLRPQAWDKMSGRAFEDQVVLWLKQAGYEQVAKTEYYDEGVDILALYNGRIVGVQVKRSSRPVGVGAIRAVIGGLKSYGCDQAMVVTNAKFTAQAARLALVNDCQLIDGARLRAGPS